MVLINMNRKVKVKLNEYGIQIYSDRYNKVNSLAGKIVIPSTDPIIDDKGFTEFQLWELMHLFGEYIMIGCKIPFETVLYFDGNDIKEVETVTK